jgi:hypothetical protein
MASSADIQKDLDKAVAALDAGSTTAGVLTYVGAIDATNPTYANMTIRLVGIQGTITSVDSFFYQG